MTLLPSLSPIYQLQRVTAHLTVALQPADKGSGEPASEDYERTLENVKTLLERCTRKVQAQKRAKKNAETSNNGTAAIANSPHSAVNRPFALLIDGHSLEYALRPELEGTLLAFASECKAVIACRVTPKQKGDMVKLVAEGTILPKSDADYARRTHKGRRKERQQRRRHSRKVKKPSLTPIAASASDDHGTDGTDYEDDDDDDQPIRTLAVGDGANDVTMIQQAHVGVGISGYEGRQAVNAADFAIARFRFLERLLLVHGSWNYVRISKLVLFTFYKNILLAITQYWFAFFTACSFQKFYLEAAWQAMNMVNNGILPIILAVMDQQLSADTLLKYPQTYQNGQKNAVRHTYPSRTMLKLLKLALARKLPTVTTPLHLVQDFSPAIFAYWTMGTALVDSLVIYFMMDWAVSEGFTSFADVQLWQGRCYFPWSMVLIFACRCYCPWSMVLIFACFAPQIQQLASMHLGARHSHRYYWTHDTRHPPSTHSHLTSAVCMACVSCSRHARLHPRGAHHQHPLRPDAQQDQGLHGRRVSHSDRHLVLDGVH
jgi:hypothetical protein